MPINSVDIHRRSLRADSAADVLRHLLPLGAQKCQRLIQLILKCSSIIRLIWI